jgi:hypothetical protein
LLPRPNNRRVAAIVPGVLRNAQNPAHGGRESIGSRDIKGKKRRAIAAIRGNYFWSFAYGKTPSPTPRWARRSEPRTEQTKKKNA